ncbi:MAG TPA: hypothetical protein VN231_08995 [Allosphingosinicella sp.]|nr:hypothetical protein [Allosphingosinicella sp.]
MTFRIDGAEVGEAIGIAMTVGGIVALLVVALLVYLVVRPPRRPRVEARREPEAIDGEEMLAVIERMERRLEVLERAVTAEARPQGNQLLEAGEAPETRRTK